VFVCGMGVDPAPVGPDRIVATRRNLLERAGISEANLIIYAGRVSPEKHVDALPHVLGRIDSSPKPTHLFIAGDGPLREDVMRAASAAAPGRVHWIGHINDKGVLAEFLSAADVFLHPNPAEPFGIGPLEAMALGVPLVAPESGGILSSASRQIAWLAPPGVSGLAEALQNCLDNPDERKRRAVKGRLVARQYSWKRAATRFFEAYERVHVMRLSKHERCYGGDSCVLPRSPLSEHSPLR
jgi:alpha-1,6-mannosyltransferase